MQCERKRSQQEKLPEELQTQGHNCGTTDGQVQLPGKTLLQTDDTVGKHSALTGERVCHL